MGANDRRPPKEGSPSKHRRHSNSTRHRNPSSFVDKLWMALLALGVYMFSVSTIQSFNDVANSSFLKQTTMANNFKNHSSVRIGAGGVENKQNSKGILPKESSRNKNNERKSSDKGSRKKEETNNLVVRGQTENSGETGGGNDVDSSDDAKANIVETKQMRKKRRAALKKKEHNDKEGNKEDTGIAFIPRVKPKKKKRKPKQDTNRTLSPEEKLKYTYEETAIMSNVSNAIFYKDIPSEFLVPDSDRFVWDRSELQIPNWMKDYFRWHRYKRSTWQQSDFNWTATYKSERWLVSQCLMTQDRKRCGGTSDRLKPVPTLLRYAYETKRVYLIRWTRPSLLEEFLMPPQGGFDWRVPPELGELMEDASNGKRLGTRPMIAKYVVGGMALIRSRLQVNEPHYVYNNMVFGENYTTDKIVTNPDVEENEPTFETVFAGVWKVFFTPSLAIQTILKTKIDQMGLVPNRYVSTHLRALYSVDSRSKKNIQRFSTNALACATELYPSVPIFFASDSTIATRYALSFNDPDEHRLPYFAGDLPTTLKVVASVPNPDPPWHLDSYVGPVENFYDTFLDLYLLAMGRCLTYSKGGYGHWAMLIGGNLDCSKRQHWMGRKVNNPDTDFCHFSTTAALPATSPRIFGNDKGPLFLPPMTN